MHLVFLKKKPQFQKEPHHPKLWLVVNICFKNVKLGFIREATSNTNRKGYIIENKPINAFLVLD